MRHRTPPARRAGMTLVELMVAVSVLAVGTSIAIPRITAIRDQLSLEAAAQELVHQLNLTRSEAIKRNRELALQFSGAGPTTTWCYGLRVDDGVACDCTETDVTAADACQIDGVLRVTRSTDYPSVSLATNLTGARTEFEPRQGLANVAGTNRLVLKGDELRVIVSTLGRVKICTQTGMPGYEPCP